MIPSTLTSTGLTPVGFDVFQPPEDPPRFFETFKASFNLDNDVVNAFRSITQQGIQDDEDPNAWMETTGFAHSKYEQNYLDSFISVRSEGEARAVMSQIDKEEEYRDILARSGFTGFLTGMAAGIASPLTLVPIFGWYSAMARTGRAARTAFGAGVTGASAAGAVAVQEAILHSTQETRTVVESVFNIAGATILGSVLGGGAAALSRGSLDELAARIMNIPTTRIDEEKLFNDIVAGLPGAPVGAQVSTAGRGTGELAGALGAERALGFQDPLIRSQRSEFEASRNTVRDLAESPLTLAENRQGIATSIGGAVETRMKMASAPLAQALRDMDLQFQTYYFGGRARFAPLRSELARRRGDQRLTYSEFKEAVFDSLYRNDVSDVAEIQQSAANFRRLLFAPMMQQAEKEGIPLGTMLGDESYVPRVFNSNAVRARESEFVDVLQQHFAARQADLESEIQRLRAEKASPSRIATLEKARDLTPDEIKSLAQETVRLILRQSPIRVVTPQALVEGPKGPLHEHMLNIPTRLVRDFLERDVEVLSRMFTRTMSADINLSRKFGSADMEGPINKILEEKSRLIERVRQAELEKRITPAEARIENRRLNKKAENAIRDISAIRDRLRGTYVIPENPDALLYRAGNVIRNINYMRLLGGMTISAFPDIAKPVFHYGLGRTFSAFVPFVMRTATIKLAQNEVKLAGTALDMILDSRVMAIADVLDDYGRGSKFERGLAAATRRFGLMSLMSPWNATIKQFTGVVAQTKMLQLVGKVVDGTASTKEIGWLAAGGIDANMAGRIWNQFAGAGPNRFNQPAWHGSPHRFDRFSTKKIGTGEGAQAFGWGLYFAGKKDVAAYYKDALGGTKGHLYQVDLPGDDELALWDAPWSKQPPAVREALDRIPEFYEARLQVQKDQGYEPDDPAAWDHIDFQDIYEWMGSNLERRAFGATGMRNADELASRLILEGGVPGHRFLDAGSRKGDPNPTYNYVIYDDRKVSIQSFEQRAFHGSAVDFDRFETERADFTGQGWGAYFTHDRGMADLYRELKADDTPAGFVYEVEIPDPTALARWESPVAGQTSQVQRAMDGIEPVRGDETFEQWYRRAAQVLGDDKAVSKALNDAGVPGHSYPDPSQPEGSKLENIVVYGDEHIQIISRDSPQPFEQPDQAPSPAGPRGRITMSEGRTIVELFKSRDASTFMHESGHKFLDELTRDAVLPGAPKLLIDDYNKTLKWLKVSSAEELRSRTPEAIAANEKWAQGWERYLATGKAPSQYLTRIFQQFKDWLLKIYESIRYIGINPPNEIRGVMNRMLDKADTTGSVVPDRAVFDDVQRQLTAAGMSKDEADANAAIWAARYATRATRRGRGEAPEALYRAEGLDVRGVASRPSGAAFPARPTASGGPSVVVPAQGHGTQDGGVWWANTADWQDEQAVEAFRAFVVREVDRAIVTPGQDIPLWMSKPLGRIIGQFKSFGLASVQRTLLSGLQQRDMATLNGVFMMMGLGALTYYLKSQLAGTPVSSDPKKWITEALVQSGLLGWLMDANNISEKMTGGRVGLSAFSGEFASRYASQNAGASLLGPTGELLVENLPQLGRAIFSGEWSEADVHVARRLIPLQNLFYLRSLFDAAETGMANAFGVGSRN